jgi:hypothetical protein
VGHYSRVLGRRRDRAFPHYIFGLGHQRAAEQADGQAASGDVAAHHRTAVKALTLAEAVAELGRGQSRILHRTQRTRKR